MIEIRQEEPGDVAAIHQLNLAAFDNGPEAALVDKLRLACGEYLSFVAVEEGSVVGHILFTPAVLENGLVRGMGLAPMAVLPARQGGGIGSRLVRHGLTYVRDAGCPFVIVLGHPAFYTRFGFERASHHNIRSQWEGVPDEAFMITVFNSGPLPEAGGVANYRQEFDEAM